MFKADNNKIVEVSNKVNKIVVNLIKNNKSKNLTCMSNIRAIKESNFLTPNTKKAFNHSK